MRTTNGSSATLLATLLLAACVAPDDSNPRSKGGDPRTSGSSVASASPTTSSTAARPAGSAGESAIAAPEVQTFEGGKLVLREEAPARPASENRLEPSRTEPGADTRGSGGPRSASVAEAEAKADAPGSPAPAMNAAPASGGGARARSDDASAPAQGAADGAEGAAAPARRRPGWDSPPPSEPAAANVKSGEWDDNANWREFVRYLPTAPRTSALDVSMRRFVAVVDRDGKPVPNCEVELSQGQTRVTLTTSSTGRALFFPRAEGFGPGSAQAEARCGQGQPVSVDLRQEDGLARIDLATSRQLGQERVVDLVFVLDTTGSMSEEIRALVSTIERVAEMLEKEQVSMRLGLVEYKDRGDRYVTRTTPMTRDVQGFLARLREVRASGGGDLPEDMNEAVRVGVERMAWSDDSVARLAFVIADAPPHLDYGMQTPYSESAKRANHEGIVIHTVAASGMDDLGQSVFRQMAQLTGGSAMFVLRGGAGPASTGGGDPKSSCGGTQSNFRSGNLHELVRNKVWAALKAVDADPTKVAGLGRDESAVPCEQRIQQVVWQPR